MSSSAIPCALRQRSESDNERLIGTCSLNRRSPKMWTYTATLFSYNIVVSCACAATHKKQKQTEITTRATCGSPSNYKLHCHSQG